MVSDEMLMILPLEPFSCFSNKPPLRGYPKRGAGRPYDADGPGDRACWERFLACPIMRLDFDEQHDTTFRTLVVVLGEVCLLTTEGLIRAWRGPDEACYSGPSTPGFRILDAP